MKKFSQIILNIFYMTCIIFSQPTINTSLLNELGIGLNDANGIVVEENYAYISVNNPICGLYVLDISNTDSLRIVGYVSLPSCSYDDVAYKNGYVYVGSSIVDATNPEEPVLIGDIGFPDASYRYCEIYGDTLFVTVGMQLWIFDISNPDSPNNLGVYFGSNYYGEFALYGNHVLICRNGGLDVVDISNVTNPTLTGGPSFEYISDTDSDIEISGDFAFVAAGDRLQVLSIANTQYPGLVATLNDAGRGPMELYSNYAITTGGDEVKIIDINQIDAPTVVATYDMQFGDWSANPKDFWIKEDKLYIVGDGHVGLEIVEISNPLSPTLAGSFIRGNIKAIEKKDNFLYLLNPYEVGGSSTYEDHRIQIIDITDLSNPIINNNVFTTYNGLIMTLFDHYLGVATYWSDPWSNRDASFDIIDISNPSEAQLISSSSLSIYAFEIEVFNNKAFIADESKIIIFDVTDPHNPQNITTYGGEDIFDIAVDSTVLAVINNNGGVLTVDLVDISDLPSTTFLSSIPTGGYSSQVNIINEYLYIGLPDGIHVYNISDPINPSFVQYYVTDSNPSFIWNDNILMYGDGKFLNINESGKLESAGNLDINISSSWKSYIENSNLYTGYSSLKIFTHDYIVQNIQSPHNLTVTPGNQQITLQWDANTESDLAEYRIYRDTSSPASTLIDSVVGTPPDTFYIDTDLTNGQTYYYRITAVDDAGNESEFSSEVSTFPSAFSEQTGISLPGVYNSSVAWGDYDNDGDLDILLTGESSSGWISKIYSNNDDATFSEQTGISLTGVEWGSVAWGDHDNDGDLDILLTGQAVSGYVSKIYRNNSDNTFTEQTGISLTGVLYSSIAWGDYDNDGDLDVLLTGYANSGNFISKIYSNNGDNSFTEHLEINLTGVYFSSVAWGDYDNDGDLDIILTGVTSSDINISKIYRNDGNNSFTEQTGSSLVGVRISSVAWGDYDNDGDLDILLTEQTNINTRVSKIYRNNGDNSFTEQTGISLTGVGYGSVAWGDYDNDGDLDILLTGYTDGSTYVSKIYSNNGDNSFTEQTGISLTGVRNSSVAWGDYDNDGDLDILLTGEFSSGYASKIYRNNNMTANSVPIAPTGLNATSIGSDVIFSWDKSTDTETSQNGLTYNLYVSTTPGGCQVKSPMADISSGYRKVVQLGNVNHCNSYTLKGLPDGNYYWSVQAIDNTFAGSAFSPEASFTIPISPAVPQNLTATPGDQQITLHWNHNIESDLHKYNIYQDTSSPATTLIDSIVGTPPDTFYIDDGLTNGQIYYYRITAVDDAGNESDFSDEVSAIPGDYVSPVITLTAPVEGFSIPEYEPLTVTWTATDNIAMDSIQIIYSNEADGTQQVMGKVPADSSQFIFDIPAGVTKQAMVSLRAWDTSGNDTLVHSPNFKVTDNTPPEVALLTRLQGSEFAIGSMIQIEWIATDNVEVTTIDLLYSTDLSGWKSI
ncbi:MAG: FG-GAP-like repeat-containing protein, partial [bacterium]